MRNLSKFLPKPLQLYDRSRARCHRSTCALVALPCSGLRSEWDESFAAPRRHVGFHSGRLPFSSASDKKSNSTESNKRGTRTDASFRPRTITHLQRGGHVRHFPHAGLLARSQAPATVVNLMATSSAPWPQRLRPRPIARRANAWKSLRTVGLVRQLATRPQYLLGLWHSYADDIEPARWETIRHSNASESIIRFWNDPYACSRDRAAPKAATKSEDFRQMRAFEGPLSPAYCGFQNLHHQT